MSANTFKLFTVLIAAGLGGVLAWSLIASLPFWVPAAAVVVALILKFTVRRKTMEVLADERQIHLGYRASTITYRVLSVGMALTGFAFILFRNSLPDEYQIIGTTIGYTVCVMLVVYLVSYAWLNLRSS